MPVPAGGLASTPQEGKHSRREVNSSHNNPLKSPQRDVNKAACLNAGPNSAMPDRTGRGCCSSPTPKTLVQTPAAPLPIQLSC